MPQPSGKRMLGTKISSAPILGRRALLKSAAALRIAGLSWASSAASADSQTDVLDNSEVPITMKDIPAGRISVERRGQVVLIGLNRPYIQNRLDPEAFSGLARAYYDYDRDPTLRAAVLFGHGQHFFRGIDVDAFKALVGTGKPLIGSSGAIDPLAKRKPNLTKPLIVAVHGDTWNMADELFLVADIRIAAANTNFGQDENTHGRFPGGGSTSNSCGRPAGATRCAHADRGSLVGWEASRMGTVQVIEASPQAALTRVPLRSPTRSPPAVLSASKVRSPRRIWRSTRERPMRSRGWMRSTARSTTRTTSRRDETPKPRDGRPSITVIDASDVVENSEWSRNDCRHPPV